MMPRQSKFLGATTACLFFAASAHAALPPDAQNMKDLGVMMDFIGAHPAVSRTVRQLDLDTNTVHWGDDCIAYFVRDVPEGGEDSVPMPGPQPPLVFGHATCPID